ncbi:DUF4397 domain-containing protein [Chitinophaga filiformis]|uniref:DUF4397 domain-containing protein n=1 Tax=Chitinophaga filiformis TaxID=104663 RepID=A0A1G8CY35_CHIFI|nr:DUF4397 domain-containing protein [Chitinophaga filiformis]SDH50497.1 protein of unknown function [Chitinophaga filiformis]
MLPLNRASKGLLGILALTGLFTFSSCSKDDDNTTVEPDATVKIVNVLPDAGSVDVFNGSSKLNSSTIAYGESTGYLNVKKGDATFDFKSSVSGNTVLSAPVTFEKSENYSLFATGETNGNTTVGILAKDNLGAPSSGMAKIRFVHASPDAPAFNFLANDNVLQDGVAYKSSTEFKELAAGTYTIKLNNATSGVTATTRPDVVLQAGKIYTVVAQGLINATPVVEQPFALNIMANN